MGNSRIYRILERGCFVPFQLFFSRFCQHFHCDRCSNISRVQNNSSKWYTNLLLYNVGIILARSHFWRFVASESLYLFYHGGYVHTAKIHAHRLCHFDFTRLFDDTRLFLVVQYLRNKRMFFFRAFSTQSNLCVSAVWMVNNVFVFVGFEKSNISRFGVLTAIKLCVQELYMRRILYTYSLSASK